jgi:endo-1,4-beta-xylanase
VFARLLHRIVRRRLNRVVPRQLRYHLKWSQSVSETIEEVGAVPTASLCGSISLYKDIEPAAGVSPGVAALSPEVTDKLVKLINAVMKLVAAQIQLMLDQAGAGNAGTAAGMPAASSPSAAAGPGASCGGGAPGTTGLGRGALPAGSPDGAGGTTAVNGGSGHKAGGSGPETLNRGEGCDSPLGPDAGPSGDSLKRRAAEHGMYMGTAVGAGQIDDPEFTKKVKSQFNTVTPENEMKWDEIANNGYGKADKIVDWAERNGLQVRGHTLAWHNQAPDALNGMGAGEVRQAMTDHIDKTVKHFGDKVPTWDVVNEAFADGGGGGFRDSPFSRAMGGQGFLDQAFIAARKAGGLGKELVLNDYSVETKNAKSDAMYEAVKSMKQRGIPIDAVGFQAHVKAGDDLSSMAANIKRFKDLGVNVQITELDVKGGDDAAKAATVRDVWEAAREGGASGISTWGVSDKDSWLKGQGDLGSNAGLPFDEKMNLKKEMLEAAGG